MQLVANFLLIATRSHMNTRSHTHISILCFLNLMVPFPATFTHLRKISCASCGAARQLSFSLFVWHLLTTQTTSGFCANPRFCSLSYNRSIHDHLLIFISTVCFSCILNPNQSSQAYVQKESKAVNILALLTFQVLRPVMELGRRCMLVDFLAYAWTES